MVRDVLVAGEDAHPESGVETLSLYIFCPTKRFSFFLGYVYLSSISSLTVDRPPTYPISLCVLTAFFKIIYPVVVVVDIASSIN